MGDIQVYVDASGGYFNKFHRILTIFKVSKIFKTSTIFDISKFLNIVEILKNFKISRI